MSDGLLHGQPHVVGTEETPLCVRLAKAVESGSIKDLGQPLRTVQSEFMPQCAEYACPREEKCALLTALGGGRLVLLSSMPSLLKPHEEAYELPPEASLILECLRTAWPVT